jgi:exodeoxyribonuclease VII large subunit
MEIVRGYERRLDELDARVQLSAFRLLERKRDKWNAASARLDALSPLNVLTRGYSLTQTADGAVLRDAGKVRIGDTLRTRLHRGQVSSLVTAIEGPPDE